MELIKLKYSRELIRKTALALWWKTTGFKFCIALTLVLLWLVPNLFDGVITWKTMTALCIAVLGCSIAAAAYFIPLRRSLAKLERMGEPLAELLIGDENMVVSTSMERSEIPWSQIEKVLKMKESWSFRFVGGDTMILPLENVSSEQQDLLISRIQRSGENIA